MQKKISIFCADGL